MYRARSTLYTCESMCSLLFYCLAFMPVCCCDALSSLAPASSCCPVALDAFFSRELALVYHVFTCTVRSSPLSFPCLAAYFTVPHN